MNKPDSDLQDALDTGLHGSPAPVASFMPITPRSIIPAPAEPASVMAKKTKLRWSLLPWSALRECVEVMEFGAKKHTDDGWKSVQNGYTTYRDAAARHLAALMEAPDTNAIDSETGRHHAFHLACCALIMGWFYLMGPHDQG